MKKLVLLLSLSVVFLSPSIAQASSQNSDNSLNVQESSIQPRAFYKYRFDSIPPKKFNGMTRFYYEFDSRNNVYIGYYQ